jgi:hypothetical protein
MNNKHITVAILLFLFLAGRANAQVPLTQDKIKTKQLKPAILYWDFGTIETIYPSEDSLGSYWNVIHRSPEPDANTDGYDFYKMDAKTLRPLVSEMRHPGFIHYRIDFTAQQAALYINDGKDSIRYTIALPNLVSPEGPGSPAFWGSLPLKPGFEIEYQELDRWAGKTIQKGVLVKKKLKVTGEEVLTIDQQKVPTYLLDIRSDAGSNLKVWVMKETPHYWVKVDYRPTPDRVMKSQVTRILLLK